MTFSCGWSVLGGFGGFVCILDVFVSEFVFGFAAMFLVAICVCFVWLLCVLLVVYA